MISISLTKQTKISKSVKKKILDNGKKNFFYYIRIFLLYYCIIPHIYIYLYIYIL